MPLILPRKSLLAYPAGRAPGFDPAHVAARGISGGEGISIVAVNGNFVDLTTGRKGAKTGLSGAAITSGTGLGVRILINEYFDFTGNRANTPPGITLAAIVQFDTVNDGAYHSLIQPDTTGNLALLALNNTGQLVVYMAGDVNSNIFPAANTPYFIAASVGGTGGTEYNFAVTDLRTGKVLTARQVSTAIGAVNGTYRIGNNSTNSQATNGPLAAAMYAPTYLTLQQLVQWAQDPWAFWYPNKMLNLTSDTVTPVTPTVTTLYSLMNVG